MNSTFLAAVETLQNGLIVFLIGAVLSGLIVPLRRNSKGCHSLLLLVDLPLQ